ncbi:acetolactate synthase small subunit [Candidatus Daviesbacteria bacterium]|nr:acetolactate synthase small subunit [Candidatus Daviesbacteria bacterium]
MEDKQKKKFTMTIFTENKPGVLYRIADVFLRRKINVESLTVSEIESGGVSRFTIVQNMDEDTVKKVVKQLNKIIEVLNVYASLDDELYYNEIALIKVGYKTKEDISSIYTIVAQEGAKVVLVNSTSVIVEGAGTEKDIETLLNSLKPFGIKDIAISGRTAVLIHEAPSITAED